MRKGRRFAIFNLFASSSEHHSNELFINSMLNISRANEEKFSSPVSRNLDLKNFPPIIEMFTSGDENNAG